MKLPRIPVISIPAQKYGLQKSVQSVFSGLDHTSSCRDGGIYDMRNLTGEHSPALASRPPRYRIMTQSLPQGIFHHDGRLAYAADGGFYFDGEYKGAIASGRKSFASLGPRIIIMPDKKYYDSESDIFGSLEAEITTPVTFSDGTYAGEAAEACAIVAPGVTFPFKVGDAVEISGCVLNPSNNKTIIIREISAGTLTFYEHSFELGGESSVTIKRALPDMDFICSNENRLWGCRDNTIYASKLGDAENFAVYDGLATDSWTCEVGEGDFTAAFSYLGYPCFFSEDHIYKVYGSRPGNFQVMGSASLGVERGSENSLAIAGEVLYYKSRIGVAAWSGGIPKSISSAFGAERFCDCTAGSDGIRYYLSAKDAEGVYRLYCYDTRLGAWYREGDSEVISFSWGDELYGVGSDGGLYLYGNPRSIPEHAVPEGKVESFCEFGPFYENEANLKGVSKIQLRLWLDRGAELSVYLKYDAESEYSPASVISSPGERVYYIPLIPRRGDRIYMRLEGVGAWRLISRTFELYTGSEHY